MGSVVVFTVEGDGVGSGVTDAEFEATGTALLGENDLVRVAMVMMEEGSGMPPTGLYLYVLLGDDMICWYSHHFVFTQNSKIFF